MPQGQLQRTFGARQILGHAVFHWRCFESQFRWLFTLVIRSIHSRSRPSAQFADQEWRKQCKRVRRKVQSTYCSVHALLNQFMIDVAVLACSEPIRSFVLHWTPSKRKLFLISRATKAKLNWIHINDCSEREYVRQQTGKQTKKEWLFNTFSCLYLWERFDMVWRLIGLIASQNWLHCNGCIWMCNSMHIASCGIMSHVFFRRTGLSGSESAVSFPALWTLRRAALHKLRELHEPFRFHHVDESLMSADESLMSHVDDGQLCPPCPKLILETSRPSRQLRQWHYWVATCYNIKCL